MASTATSLAARRPPLSHTVLGSVFLMVFLLLLLPAAASGQQFVPPAVAGSWNSNGGNPTAMCFQVQRIRHFCPPFPALAAPPPPPSEMEIDPRYGVEKRLVPSGPNPLHN